MFYSIQEILRKVGCELIVKKRYFDGFYVGIEVPCFDDSTSSKDGNIAYSRNVTKAIEDASERRPFPFYDKLAYYTATYDEFLVVCSDNLYDALTELEKRASKWNELTEEGKRIILFDFVQDDDYKKWCRI